MYAKVWMSGLVVALCAAYALAEPIHPIEIDGSFDDWADVPSHVDAADNTHDTDHSGPDDTPAYVQHEDVDLLEFKFTHDESNLYAYFLATGVIGRTQTEATGKAGRYYVIVTIDVDNDDNTGYWLHEGGYYPTGAGYDMNMEVEFYDGTFNTGHYLNHGCLNEAERDAAYADQANGIVNVRPGTYDWYTQWVMFDVPTGLPEEIILPSGASIVWVWDKGSVYQGIIEIALSPDGHEAEMVAPFRGFMEDADGNPIMALGKTIDVSFSLEASGELAVGGDWASNTGDPILGYYLASGGEGEGEGEAAVLSVEPTHIELGQDAGTSSAITVRNDGSGSLDWLAVVILGNDWLSISPTAQTGDGTITLTYAANASPDARTGKIRVSAPAAAGSPVDVTVTQAGIRTGSLRVVIEPENARNAGAQWRVDGGGWQDSGATVSGLTVGQHLVEFKDIPPEESSGCLGPQKKPWITPASQTVDIAAGQTAAITGAYVASQKALSASMPGSDSKGDVLVIASVAGALLMPCKRRTHAKSR